MRSEALNVDCVIQFKKKSDLAKKELEHIAKTVIRDIELDEKVDSWFLWDWPLRIIHV